eukprot:CAMPEP_0204222694 /NCGR_PEP_ID=MMETSP0361-20130328/82383_1 /ASSEMBLY_ACC=CAM_ASM_000343 /TAXON_ID=268821 /ORGANISM="Scrippsiella Hangoei, Strain SHTV-5" /LENGTH=52 /DNA_ID=CAMNT_0051188349 /DNA_START=13 /DNA_END=168 /DNA_ORIENTATION=-
MPKKETEMNNDGSQVQYLQMATSARPSDVLPRQHEVDCTGQDPQQMRDIVRH